MYDAFAKGDFQTALGAFHPEVEWDGRNFPDGQIGRGHQAVIDHTQRWSAIWQDWTIELEDLEEVAPGVVVAFIRERGKSEAGVTMDERHAEAYLVRNGKIVRRVGFSDPSQAKGAVEDWGP